MIYARALTLVLKQAFLFFSSSGSLTTRSEVGRLRLIPARYVFDCEVLLSSITLSLPDQPSLQLSCLFPHI